MYKPINPQDLYFQKQSPLPPPMFILWVLLFILLFMLIFLSIARAEDWQDYSDEAIAQAIYLAEGGSRAKVWYGILSVKVKDKDEAKRVCLNTIKNNRKRFEQQKIYKDFIEFLGDKYCPTSVDPVGNKNWKVNVKFLLNKNK